MIDTYHRSGLYSLPLPATLGVEAAGVIERLGPETADLGLREGERVAYVTQAPGAYASVNVMPAERLVPLPDHVSDEVAAASLLKGLTAEMLVRPTVHPYLRRASVCSTPRRGASDISCCSGGWFSARR